jgi:hypothetical protein
MAVGFCDGVATEPLPADFYRVVSYDTALGYVAPKGVFEPMATALRQRLIGSTFASPRICRLCWGRHKKQQKERRKQGADAFEDLLSAAGGDGDGSVEGGDGMEGSVAGDEVESAEVDSEEEEAEGASEVGVQHQRRRRRERQTRERPWSSRPDAGAEVTPEQMYVVAVFIISVCNNK